MFVKKQYRGQGLFKPLLAAVEEHARLRGDHTLCIGTRVTLEPAVTLYHRSGFVDTLRDGLYVKMEKKLK